MAKKKITRRKRSSEKKTSNAPSQSANAASMYQHDLTLGLDGGQSPVDTQTYTGRMIATIVNQDKDSVRSAISSISNRTGLSASSSNVAFTGADSLDDIPDNVNFVVLEKLGIVVLNDQQLDSMAAQSMTVQDDNLVMEREMWNFPLGRQTTLAQPAAPGTFDNIAPDNKVHSTDYLLGMRDAIDLLIQNQSNAAAFSNKEQSEDDLEFTWGLKATGVADSMLSGAGVRVAVLDTGFDTGHPDFAGRQITQASFVPGSEPDNDPLDRNGHGTHCIGTSCGPANPGIGPRYGIAFGADIFSGKVLRQGPNGRAAGADGWILAGIDWAMRNECHIISMSLGSPATSSAFPTSYERAAQSGLREGILMIAATGNDSRRHQGNIAAVGRPANCPSIAAVSAIDVRNEIANFSNGQKFGNGGEVNFAGPGVAVLSSVPMPERRAVFDGTSMATPHAAGIAALICEQTGLTGIDLYREMRNRTLNLGLRTDFGYGLARVSASFT